MGFFDRPERADDDLDESVDDDPMEDLTPGPWLGGVVPVELVVAESDVAVVLVRRLAAFPDGLEFWLHSYVRRGARRARRSRRFEHPMMPHDFDPREPLPDEFLRFGVAWPDGQRATNLDWWGHDFDDIPEVTHGLEGRSGGGSDSDYEQQYWLWPLPVTGELFFVVEWPAYNIGESTNTIDSAVLVEAAGRAHSVWPEDADRPSHLNQTAIMREIRERGDDGDPGGGTFVEL